MTSAADLQLGDHVCLLYETDEALWAHTVDFTAVGLAAGQRVMVFAQALRAETVTARLRAHDPRFAIAVDADQLQVCRPDDVQLAGGVFDADRMMGGFAAATEQAGRDGYAGLRVTVDMTWALRPVPGVEGLFDFEAAASRLFTSARLAAVCAYDRRRFDRHAIRHAVEAHPITPDVSMLRATIPAPHELVVTGEVDLANREAWRGLLAGLPDGELLVDLAGMTFIDAAGVGVLAHALANHGHHVTLRCAAPIGDLLRQLRIDQLPTVSIPADAGDR